VDFVWRNHSIFMDYPHQPSFCDVVASTGLISLDLPCDMASNPLMVEKLQSYSEDLHQNTIFLPKEEDQVVQDFLEA